jgi:hypothetical protein
MVGLGGHASLNMVATYHKPNQDARDDVIKAKHGSPSKIRAQLVKQQSELDNVKDGGSFDIGDIMNQCEMESLGGFSFVDDNYNNEEPGMFFDCRSFRCLVRE